MENDEISLSKRKQEILIQAVEDYIAQASPITSGSIVEKHKSDVSSATLRNELKALEEMGYLKQLHTSSGRVPTTKGYRFFVDKILCECPTNAIDLENIREHYVKKAVNLSDLVYMIANVVSEATNYPTVVFLNGFEKLIVKNIKIVPLLTNQALMLIETNTGLINNTIELNGEFDEMVCKDASNFFTKKFSGKSIAELVNNIQSVHEELQKELQEFCDFFEYVLDTLYHVITEYNKNNILSSGTTKLLDQPEYGNSLQAKQIIDLIEDKENLKTIFNEANESVSFSIGDENNVDDLKTCSIAKANVTVDGENIASIGVFGPKRMDYAKISNALKFIIDETKQNLLLNKEKGDKNENKN